MKKYTILITCLCLLYLQIGRFSYVQAGNNAVSISPHTLYVISTPVKTFETKVRLVNQSDTTSFRPHIRRFEPGAGGSPPTFSAIDPASAVLVELVEGEWGEPFRVNPGSQIDVRVRFTVSAEAKLSDYYYSLEFWQDDVEPPQEGKVSIAVPSALSSIVLLSVMGGEDQVLGEISSMQIERQQAFGLVLPDRIVNSSHPISLLLSAANMGVHVVESSGYIEVEDMWGRSKKITLAPSTVLSASIKNMHEASICGNNICDEKAIKIDGFYVGPHTVRTHLYLGPNKKYISKTITFVGVPIFHLTALGILSIVAIFLFQLRQRTHKKEK